MWKFGRLIFATVLVVLASGCVIQVPASEPQVTREQVETEIQAEASAESAARLDDTCDSLAQELNAMGTDLHAHLQRMESVLAKNPDLSGLQLMASHLASDTLAAQSMNAAEREQAVAVYLSRYEEFIGDLYTLCGWK